MLGLYSALFTVASVLLVIQFLFVIFFRETYIDDNDNKLFKILRADFGRPGGTIYECKNHEVVKICRLIGREVTIEVGAKSRVERIQVTPLFGHAYSLTLQDDSTVNFSYFPAGGKTTVHRYKEFARKFRWAEKKVEQTRRRYARLFTGRFIEAFGSG